MTVTITTAAAIFAKVCHLIPGPPISHPVYFVIEQPASCYPSHPAHTNAPTTTPASNPCQQHPQPRPHGLTVPLGLGLVSQHHGQSSHVVGGFLSCHGFRVKASAQIAPFTFNLTDEFAQQCGFGCLMACLAMS